MCCGVLGAMACVEASRLVVPYKPPFCCASCMPDAVEQVDAHVATSEEGRGLGGSKRSLARPRPSTVAGAMQVLEEFLLK